MFISSFLAHYCTKDIFYLLKGGSSAREGDSTSRVGGHRHCSRAKNKTQTRTVLSRMQILFYPTGVNSQISTQVHSKALTTISRLKFMLRGQHLLGLADIRKPAQILVSLSFLNSVTDLDLFRAVRRLIVL